VVRCSGVNLTGTFLMIRSAVRPMLEQGFGRITTGRRWGRVGAPNLAHYSASKWCVIGLTKSLRLQAAV
jgi:NAD(P)-dependent dehydrogenase (short-subunit alcohol dehydrogenase family)